MTHAMPGSPACRSIETVYSVINSWRLAAGDGAVKP
jgi:hypothetical protein